MHISPVYSKGTRLPNLKSSTSHVGKRVTCLVGENGGGGGNDDDDGDGGDGGDGDDDADQRSTPNRHGLRAPESRSPILRDQLFEHSLRGRSLRYAPV